MKKSVVTCTDCSFGYDPHRRVLDTVSFDLFEGEFVSLLGPNGAGKSTLMKILLNRLVPQSGKVQLDGVSVRNYSEKMIASIIGYVEQSTPRSSMNVIDYILLGAISQFSEHRFWYSAAETSRARELLADFGLEPLANHSIDRISGGEQQLVQICRALMSSPKVLLLDEPVSHLDINHIDTVISRLLKIVRERNVTVFASVHDLYLASSCSDRLFLLDHKGSLTAEENPRSCSLDLLEEVFKMTFSRATLFGNSENIILPSYRFR